MNAREGIKTDHHCVNFRYLSLGWLKTMNAREGIKTDFAELTIVEKIKLKTMNAREGIKTAFSLPICAAKTG